MECNADSLKFNKNILWEANGNLNQENNAVIEGFGCACNKNKELLSLQQKIDEDEEEWFTPFYKNQRTIEGFVSSENSNEPKIQINKWENNEPKMVLQNILSMGFKIPTNYLPNKGGMILWKKSDMPNTLYNCKNILEELCIKDEMIMMKCPNIRHDYLYASIKLDLTPRELTEIQMIGAAYTYDLIQKILTVRFNNLEGALILLKLAVELVCKKITIGQIHNEKRLQRSLLEITNDECIINSYKSLVRLMNYLNTDNINMDGNWSGGYNNKCGPPQPYVGYDNGNLYMVYK
tara:strand:+ start:4581 stop:5456 length:876 start_codon:yes stop_codon:yes gene_type:complete